MLIKNLRNFIISSNKVGYATGTEKAWIKEKDFSTSISYKKGDWYSHDNFFGGEPYGGRTVISLSRAKNVKKQRLCVYQQMEGGNRSIFRRRNNQKSKQIGL